jgi:hypothetical protein
MILDQLWPMALFGQISGKPSKNRKKPWKIVKFARLCSVFLAVAYPLWFHCGVDKASILDHFSGIAINILFSIAPILFRVFHSFLGFFILFWCFLANFHGLDHFLAKKGYGQTPQKEVSSCWTPSSCFGIPPLASFLANFHGLDPFLMVWTIFFGEIVMVYGLSHHWLKKWPGILHKFRKYS